MPLLASTRGRSFTAAGRLLVALSCSALLLARSSSAAEAKTEHSRYRLGPVRLWPGLVAQALVDSNPYGTGTFGPSDLVFVLSPALEAEWPVGSRFVVRGAGNLDWNQYSRETSQSYTNRNGVVEADMDLGGLLLFAGMSGAQSRQLFGIDFEQTSIQQEQSAWGGARLRVSRKLSIRGEARADEYRYGSADPQSTIQQDLDRDRRSGTLRASWDLTHRTSAFTSVELADDHFLYPWPGYPSVARSRRARAGLSLSSRAAIVGQASLGIVEFPAGGAVPPYRGPLVSVALSAPLGRVARLGLSIGRDVGYSAVGRPSSDPRARSTYVSRSLGAALEGELPLDLTGRVSARMDENRYLLPVLGDSRVVPRVDYLRELRLSLGRAWRRQLWLGLDFEYAQRTSTDGYGDRRWRAGIAARLGERGTRRVQRILER